MAKWNEAEIDEIIASVEKTVEQVEALGKSARGKQVSINASAQGGPMKKDEKDGKKDGAPASDDKAPDSAPSADASASPAAQDSAAPAADAAPAPSESAPGAPAADAAPAPEAGQPGEGQLEQPELSDEELHEIYGQMPHEELERHFMVIRSLLQDAYAQQDGAAPAAGAPAPDASAAAPAPEAGMGKGEKQGEKEGSMNKAEQEKLVALEKANGEMVKQLELLAKAVEIGFKPQRKSIEGIDYIRKSDGEGPQPSNLSKAEITERCNKLDFGKLSKDDREAINAYMLNDDMQAKARVEKLVGGK